MAPLASAPEQLLVVLNPPRRRVLMSLSQDIIAQLRSQYFYDTDKDNQLVEWDDDSKETKSDSSDDDDSKSSHPTQDTPRPSNADHSLVILREGALAHFDSWSREFLEKLRDFFDTADSPKVQVERRNRSERLAAAKSRRGGTSGIDARFRAGVAALQSTYHPVPSSLNTISLDDRKEIISSVLLFQLVEGNYSAHASVFMRTLTSSLDLPLEVLATEEIETAQMLIQASANKQTMSADAETAKRRQRNEVGRIFKVGLASVAGAAVIGITGGLAAPVVAGAIGGLMGTVGLGGVASILSVFAMNGALVGALFGAYGAQMTGRMMDKYAKEVEDFKFIPLRDDGLGATSTTRRIRVTIGINGWLSNDDDVTNPWRCLGDDTEAFALRYEMKILIALGKALEGLVQSYAWKTVKMEILKRTVLASLLAALWPAFLISMATNIDNPFSLARNRSDKAGKVLADALINKVQGERPVTLVGYSLGARVIYSCLKSLADRQAYGLIDTVVLIGAPAPSDRNHWLAMKSVVSGNIHNVYSSNDLILAFMYRTSSLQLGVAGLQDIQNVEGVQNMDLTEYVSGHLRYPGLINKILARCGFIHIKGGDGTIEQDQEIVTVKKQINEENGIVETKVEVPPPPPPPKSKPSVPPKDKTLSQPPVAPKSTDTEDGPPPPLPPKPINLNQIPRRPLGQPPITSSFRKGHRRPLSLANPLPPLPHEAIPHGPRSAGRPPDFFTEFLEGASRAIEEEFRSVAPARRSTFQEDTPRRNRGRGIFAEDSEDSDGSLDPPRLPVKDATSGPVPGIRRSATAPVVGETVHPFLQYTPSSSKPSVSPGVPKQFTRRPVPTVEESDSEPEGAPIQMMDNDS